MPSASSRPVTRPVLERRELKRTLHCRSMSGTRQLCTDLALMSLAGALLGHGRPHLESDLFSV